MVYRPGLRSFGFDARASKDDAFLAFDDRRGAGGGRQLRLSGRCHPEGWRYMARAQQRPKWLIRMSFPQPCCKEI